MASDTHKALVSTLDQMIAAASTAHQSFQLAAQQADLEGHALAAGVLRSISEGHTGKAHGLLLLKAALESSEDPPSLTERNIELAIERSIATDKLSSELSADARTLLSAQQAGDLDAILGLTATNRARLENLLASVRSEQKSASAS
jgi:hypothetical protein